MQSIKGCYWFYDCWERRKISLRKGGGFPPRPSAFHVHIQEDFILIWFIPLISNLKKTCRMKRKEILEPVSWKTGLLVAVIRIISGLVSKILLGCALKRLGRSALTLETDSNLTPDILCRQQSFLLSRGKVTPSPRLIAPDQHGNPVDNSCMSGRRTRPRRANVKTSPATFLLHVCGGRMQFNNFHLIMKATNFFPCLCLWLSWFWSDNGPISAKETTKTNVWLNFTS